MTLTPLPSLRLHGLAPILDAYTRLIVLGSFPSRASLQAQRYYAHPQNQFWKILGALWGLPLQDMNYQERTDALRAHGLGVWDVYASCEREGSLDSAIVQPQLNDLAGLSSRCPRLQAIAHNGGESFKHARHTRALGLPVYRLPSTSPAHASWTFERKLAAWREVFACHGLTQPQET
ncbi:MAG: DNA-deoxyinosine glycosylase [Burkholderiales bacterium RIFOXYC12_FULL_65_23]|uniref:DNA-deoxyinosine glycosylase n=1 Tax=Malikia spinosa TaxID=86180 RepID=UPI0008AD625B|nr:DNA-deoxyinosine glycosylase [Malikia spinosa]OGB71365.1 MAG: DNA-deoxyinosine glycosylase [Burkholderiales bacterium RIFOXYC12_FULL_65_23]